MGLVGARSGARTSHPSRRLLMLAFVLAGAAMAGVLVHGYGRLNRSMTAGLELALGATLLAWNWGLQRRLRHRNTELERSEAQIRATLQAIPDLLFELDREGRYLSVQSPNPQLLVGDQDQLLGRNITDVMPEESAACCFQALQEAEQKGSSQGAELLLPLPGGKRWFELSVARKTGLPGSAHTFLVLSRDIHARKTAEEELQLQINFYAVLSRCNEAILSCGSEEELLERICKEAISTGLLRMAWIGLVEPGCDVVKPVAWAGDGIGYLSAIKISIDVDSPYGRGPVGTAIREDKPFWCQDYQKDPAMTLWHERGARYGWRSMAAVPIHRGGRPVGALALYAGELNAFAPAVQTLVTDMVADLDLALDRFRVEAERQRLAHFDQLTGLANRELLQQEFQFVLNTCLREGQPVAVMVVNLDRFRLINDSLGSGAGDQLLVEVALRLRRRLRSSDVIARVGADEFLIVLPKLWARDVAVISIALQEAVAEPWLHDGRTVAVTASIGIAMAPDDGEEPDQLAQKANLALHEAKQQEPNSYRFFTEELQARTARTMQLSNALRLALGRGEFWLAYQPQVDTTTGAVVGAEALLRWQHPELGAIRPDEFIPVAERSGLILPIGAWVLRCVIDRLRTWIDAGISPPRIAVNLSALQFRQSGLADQIGALLVESGVPAELLEVELTETATTERPEDARRTIEQLNRLGVSFAIDDFGTGYSSLSNLSLIKAHKLKIDASFIRDLTINSDSRAILTATLTMARAMGMRTLAEGVEQHDQWAFLQEHGCDSIQGYLFSKPLAPEEFTAYLAQQRANPNTRELSPPQPDSRLP